MKLKNNYDLQGSPNRVEYKRNKNGLYTVDIKDYIIVKPDGQKYKASFRVSNAELSVDNEEDVIYLNKEDVIYLNKEDIKYLSVTDKLNDTIWEMIIPDVQELN